jgi:hypothetical protein
MNTKIEKSASCEVHLVLNAKNVVHDSHSQGMASLQFVAVSLAASQAFTCLSC